MNSPINYGPNQNYNMPPKQKEMHIKSQNKGNLMEKFYNAKFLLVVVIVLQVLIFGILAYYFFVISAKTQNQKIIDAAEEKAQIQTEETPTLLKLANAQQLKDQNAIQAQVYKDAKDGDYVLLYSDKMVIYRTDGKKIIYQGDTPTQISEANQEQLVSDIVSRAKEKGIVDADSTDSPELSVVTDVETLKANNPTFYADVEQGDVIAVFSDKNLILLYRPSTKVIFQTGDVATSITTK